ncbi:MAG: hypothetical protein CL779_00965 [Chloroflexi bacterium]|nr:hypothetical protein [Chloroflexota bacterium]|tara:strand:+ start:7740 stop:8453 length:714 start_codon:yes stop_codon:yes gene_type:complete
MFNNITVNGILLDLDDTLVDSRSSWKQGFQDTFKSYLNDHKHNFDLEEIYLEYTKIVSTKHEITNAQEWSDKLAQAGLLEIINKYIKIKINIADAWMIFEKSWKKNIKLFSETNEILKSLQKNYKLGLVTNGLSEHQRYKIEKFDLKKYFQCILISEEVGFQKPEVEIFNQAAQKLDLSNNQIIHIGDNPSHDVIGANESGMFSCWLKRPKNWYKEIKDVEPNFIISNLLELKNLNK